MYNGETKCNNSYSVVIYNKKNDSIMLIRSILRGMFLIIYDYNYKHMIITNVNNNNY